MESLSNNLQISEAKPLKHMERAIGRGRNIKRLTFEGANHSSLRIAAKATKDICFIYRYILFRFFFAEIEGTDVSLNIRSASKRLGMSHQEVRNLAARGKDALEQAFNKRAELLAEYKKIVKEYTIDHGLLKRGDVQTPFKPETILKTIVEGLQYLSNHFVEERKVFFSQDLTCRCVFIETLGRGAFGVVKRAFDLISKTMVAIKQVEDLNNEKSIDSMRNERYILLQLEGHRAFQSPPSEVTIITDQEKESAVYQTEFMNGGDLNDPFDDSMEKFYEMPMNDLLTLWQPVVEGLAYMHEQNIVHRDIKPANFLMENDGDGSPIRIIFSDFGSARVGKDSPIDMENEDKTAFYTCETEDTTEAEADVFAFALSLIEILTKKGFQTEKIGESTAPQNKDEGLGAANHKLLTDANVPKELADLLLETIGPKENRLTATQFKDRYNEILDDLN